jgi:hypothetical protein
VFLTPKDDAAARKKKIVKAISRWHPDKFNAIFGSKLVSFYFYFRMGNSTDACFVYRLRRNATPSWREFGPSATPSSSSGRFSTECSEWW